MWFWVYLFYKIEIWKSEKKFVFKYKDKDYLYRIVFYNKLISFRSLFVGVINFFEKKSLLIMKMGFFDWLMLFVNYGIWDGYV